MKALILNSGIGRRMGTLVSEHPKCMTEISGFETILSRQLRLLSEIGITEIIMTTGLFADVLVNYCKMLALPVHITYVKNPLFDKTNYIYSIYCAKDYLRDEDIILMHGDLVFENEVLEKVISNEDSCMAVSTKVPLPEKDFKAEIDDKYQISNIGVEFFNHAVTAQPLYKCKKDDWEKWLDAIEIFCENGEVTCYAEKAFNQISNECKLRALDVEYMLCQEIDTPEDLAVVSAKLNEIENRTVYMCFSSDILHSGHISIIKKAAKLGKLIIGVLSDNAVVSYKRFPLVPYEERKALFENIAGVSKVIEQKELSYRENLEKLRPNYVVHGDDWKEGVQKPVRDEVVSVLAEYGGKLIEYPYANDSRYKELDNRARKELAMPDIRRGRLRKTIAMKGLVIAIEVHSGLTGLIAEKSVVYEEGAAHQFDAMWVSSLCDSTAKGKPDIELVDMTSRFRTIDDIMEVTTKPIIFDGDTGGKIEHFVFTVRTLERHGISAIIIEDKVGLKKNSLFGTDVIQTQDTIEGFCNKIKAGKASQITDDFMIIARIESLIAGKPVSDALERAFAYVQAGADGIMIHSKNKSGEDIKEFCLAFRKQYAHVPIVVVPTTYDHIYESELCDWGVNIIIYANHMLRAAYPAMMNVAKTILENERALEVRELCMPIKEILELIPGTK